MTSTARSPAQPRSALTGPERRGLAAVIAAISVTGITLGLTLPLIGLLLEARGASSTIIGLNTALPALAVLVLTPAVPWLVRRLGAVRFSLSCLAVTVATLQLFPLLPVIWIWFPLRFLLGLAVTGLFATSELWINALADDAHRGRILGLYATVLSAGFALGPAILQLTGIHGWAPFLTGGAIALLAGLPLWWARDVAPRIDEPPSRSVVGFVAVAPVATLAALAYGAVETGIFNLLPVYGVHSGLSAESAALMITMIGAGNTLCQLPIGWLADRMDRSRLLILCGLTGVGGAASLVWFIDLPVLLWPSLFVWGGVVVGLYTVGLTLLGQRYRGADLASANAAFILMYGVGSLIGPPLAGIAMDSWDPQGLAVALAGFCGGYVLMAIVLSKRH